MKYNWIYDIHVPLNYLKDKRIIWKYTSFISLNFSSSSINKDRIRENVNSRDLSVKRHLKNYEWLKFFFEKISIE